MHGLSRHGNCPRRTCVSLHRSRTRCTRRSCGFHQGVRVPMKEHRCLHTCTQQLLKTEAIELRRRESKLEVKRQRCMNMHSTTLLVAPTAVSTFPNSRQVHLRKVQAMSTSSSQCSCRRLRDQNCLHEWKSAHTHKQN